MHPRTLRRGVRLAVNLAAINTHPWADHWMQDSASAQGKGHPGDDGRDHCLRHVASYTATIATAQLATNTALGIRTRPGVFVLGHLATGGLHYVMDRSRESETLPRTLSRLPGVPDAIGYWRHGGRYELDQAWHWLCLSAWAVADAVTAER